VTAELDDEDGELSAIEPRGTGPFSQVGDWVALAGLSHLACRVYWLLTMHVTARAEQRARRDGSLPPRRVWEKVWPSQKRLAALCGLSTTDGIGKALADLEKIDAVWPRWESTKRGRRRVYLVRRSPPPRYDGPVRHSDAL
jgi:hypothetical protein